MSGDNGRRDASRIEADLAHNRAALEATVDKLQGKFTPGEIFDQAWRYARARNADGTTSRMKDSVVRNPLPVALVGLGIAWLLLSGRQGSVPSQRRDSTRGVTPEPESAPAAQADSTAPAGVAKPSVAPTPVSTVHKPAHTQGATPPPAASARSTPPANAEPMPKPARQAAVSAGPRPDGPPAPPIGRP